MRRRLFLSAIACTLMMFAGMPNAAAADLPKEVVGVTWELVTLQAAGQAVEDTTGRGLTIMFNADGTVSGFGGCNQFTGGYTADTAGKLTFTPLASTLRACAEPGVSEREARYYATLQEVTGYALDGTTGLRLTFAQQGRQLVYRRGAAAATTQVTGTAIYLPRILPPPNSVVTVQLVDTSRQDVPAIVLAEQTIPTNGGGPPYAYALTYDPAKIVANNTYQVQARLESDGRLLFRTTRAYLVITRGNPTTGVEVVMDQISAPTMPPLGGGGMARADAVRGPMFALALGGLLVAIGILRRYRRA